MTEAGASGRFQATQTLTLTCNNGNFAAPSAWPACVDSNTQTCTAPAGADTSAKGFNNDPDSGAPTADINPGDTLTYSCSDSGHVVGNTAEKTITVTCTAAEASSDPWWEAKWDNLVADWDSCAAPILKRKKRAEEEEDETST